MTILARNGTPFFLVKMPWILHSVLSVSVLNVILNTIVFFLSYFAGLVAAWGIRNLLLLRLQKHGSAPILIDSGTIAERTRQFLTRILYWQCPTRMLIIFLSSVVFLLFEVSAESGVDSSNRCAPFRARTNGICGSVYNGDGSTAKNIASALYTQQVKWDADSLVRTPIVQGFRQDFDGNEAFVPDKVNTSLPIIVSGCSVHSFQLLPPNSTEIVLLDRMKMWNMEVVSVKPPGESFALRGHGDLTGNQKYYDAFLIVANASGGMGKEINADMYDYTDSKHIFESMARIYSSGLFYRPATIRNRGNILKHTITCKNTSLSYMDFQRAIQVYRSTQLESKMRIHPAENISVPARGGGDSWIEGPSPLKASDIVKSVIALKAVDKQACEGETFQYTTCGTYDLETFMPLLGTLVVLLVIGCVTEALVRRRDAYLPIPTTAVAWSKFAYLEMCRRMDNYSIDREENDDGAEEIVNGLWSGKGDLKHAEFYLEDRGEGVQELSIRKKQ